MMNYPLTANKYDRHFLSPITNHYYSEEYTAGHYDLYLTEEHAVDENRNVHRYYRLHANRPHNIDMALAYDIKCPHCGGRSLKQVGRCKDFYTLGLYECPTCDRK